MTSLATLSKLEKELYPPITRLLEQQGLHVWEEATIRAGDEGTRTADHVAWRWVGDDIEALAVEVKPGQADVGLAQAAAYSAGFDRVFVAAEEAFRTTGYLGKIYERLGLGYIRVSPAEAAIERAADSSPFLVEAVRNENIARVRLKHLFIDSVVGEPVRFGADRRGDNWAVTGTTSEWQLCAQVVSGSESTGLSLLAESKSVGDSAAINLDPSDLAAWVGSLDRAATVSLRERRHNGFQPFYSDVLRTWSAAEPASLLADLLRSAASLSARKVGPHFEIRTELWPHGDRLAETQARTDLQAALGRLRSIQSLLNERL